MVSLKCPSSIEYGNKNIFLKNFIFYRDLLKFKILSIVDQFALFLFIFSKIFLLKTFTLYGTVLIFLSLKIKEGY